MATAERQEVDPLARDPDALLAELARLRPMAELGRLAATVAHEIRNPLTGISANAELLRDVLSDPADIESVDIIMTEVDRLSRLVSDLLHYSREREASQQTLDLGQVAHAVVELQRSEADGQGVQLEHEGHGFAAGDPELSRQCLLNIVRNAIQACRNGGAVRICVDGPVISVIDQGSGVPEALRTSLFEPFVTGRTRGLGLGAAVAKRCMERQGGSVILAQTSAAGSTFRLNWPQVGSD